jgi:hypothetical protein
MAFVNPLKKINETLGNGKPAGPGPVDNAKSAAATIVDKAKAFGKSITGGNKPKQPIKGYKKGGMVTKGKKGC